MGHIQVNKMMAVLVRNGYPLGLPEPCSQERCSASKSFWPSHQWDKAHFEELSKKL